MGSENKRTTGDLELVFAEPKGFCFGVRRAIASLEESLERHGRVYALGSPIHNPQEVERLLSKGLVIIETPSEMPMGGTVFVRAHGVSDLVMKELHSLNALVVDGTCPFVSKAKEKAALLSREGYTVMILGDEDHPEVKAIRLSSEGPVTVVDPSRLKSFEIEGLKKVGIVSQTTQRKEDLSALVSNVSAGASETRVFNTICDATSSRQGSVARLAGSVDGIIIIGGKNSANTEKLFEIANTSGTPTLWIEDEEGLERGWLEDKRRIGIAAGASTPDWLIHRIATRLASAKSGREDGW